MGKAATSITAVKSMDSHFLKLSFFFVMMVLSFLEREKTPSHRQ